MRGQRVCDSLDVRTYPEAWPFSYCTVSTAALVGTLNERRVKRIVTCDPHAFNSLKNEYPEFGGHYEVVHHTQLIAELLVQGRFRVDASLQRVVFHDPCYLVRHNGEFDAPRAVLARLCSDAPLEMALSREKAMCCGAGGRRMWLEETIGKRINILRVEQALDVQPQVIATACPQLRGDGGRRSGRIAGSRRDAVARHRGTGGRRAGEQQHYCMTASAPAVAL